jgi:hypothetical protein
LNSSASTQDDVSKRSASHHASALWMEKGNGYRKNKKRPKKKAFDFGRILYTLKF